MLPAFQENGLLPAGVHHSDLRSFEDAFAWNAHRRRIYAHMQHGLGVLHDAGYRLLVIGGEFISSVRIIRLRVQYFNLHIEAQEKFDGEATWSKAD